LDYGSFGAHFRENFEVFPENFPPTQTNRNSTSLSAHIYPKISSSIISKAKVLKKKQKKACDKFPHIKAHKQETTKEK